MTTREISGAEAVTKATILFNQLMIMNNDDRVEGSEKEKSVFEYLQFKMEQAYKGMTAAMKLEQLEETLSCSTELKEATAELEAAIKKEIQALDSEVKSL